MPLHLWELFYHQHFIGVLMVLDSMLLASFIVLVLDLLLCVIWKMARLDSYRLVPLHMGLVTVLTAWLYALRLHEAIGLCLLRGVGFLFGEAYTAVAFGPFGILTALSGLWLAGVLFQAGRYLYKYQKLRRAIRRQGIVVSCPVFDDVKALLGVSHANCIEMEGLKSAGAFGLRHPAVLVPANFGEAYTEDEQRIIFLHELYHIKHHDHCLGTAVKGLYGACFLFWPLRRMLKATLHSREMKCDRYVISVMPQPAAYAQLLLREAKSGHLIYAPFGGNGYREMRARVQAVLSKKSASLKKAALAGALTLALVALASLPLRALLAPRFDYVLDITRIDGQTQAIMVQTEAEADTIIETADGVDFASLHKIRQLYGVLGTYGTNMREVKEYAQE